MAKRKTSAKQRAAARRNIKKAQAARNRKKRVKVKRISRRRVIITAKARPRRRRRARAAAAAAAPRRRRRRTARAAAAAPRRRRRRAARAAAAAPRRRSRARRASPARRHHRRSASRRRGAMENPLSGMELFVGGITGLLGFFVADGTDRFLATHALAVKTASTSTTPAIYQDNADGASWRYPGLKNGAAIEAPMNAVRWGVGAVITATPLFLAHFVKNSSGRAALQFFGFGAMVRVLGKGLVDLSAFLLKTTSVGQQLYPAELGAMIAANPSGATATALPQGAPSVGLAGTPCAPCADKAKGLAAAPPPPAPRQTYGNVPASPPAIVSPPPTATNGGAQPFRFGALYAPGMDQ